MGQRKKIEKRTQKEQGFSLKLAKNRYFGVVQKRKGVIKKLRAVNKVRIEDVYEVRAAPQLRSQLGTITKPTPQSATTRIRQGWKYIQKSRLKKTAILRWQNLASDFLEGAKRSGGNLLSLRQQLQRKASKLPEKTLTVITTQPLWGRTLRMLRYASRMHRTFAKRIAKTTTPAREQISKHLTTPPLRNRVIAYGLMVLLAGFGVFNFVHNILAVSAIKTLTTQTDWEAGEYWNNTLDTTSATGDVQIRSGGVGTWDPATPGSPENTRGYYPLAAQVASYGADLTNDGTYVYMTWGNNLPDFWRFNPETGTWKQLADAPTSFYYNSALAYYNGKIYAISGHDGTVTTDAAGDFLEYDIATDTWSTLPDAPDAWGTVSGPGGADLKSGENGIIYGLQGNGQTGFWGYNIASNTWSNLAPVPDPVGSANSHPLSFSAKSFTVSGTTYCTSGCLYAFISARSFYRYDIAENQWYTSFADIPAALGSVANGSAMAEDPVSHVLYAFRGGNTEFMKYTVGDVGELVAGTWDAATGDTENTQRNVTTGGALTFLTVNGQKYVYGLLGGVPDLVRYDVGNSRWDMIITQTAEGTNSDHLLVFVPNGADCSDATGCLFHIAPNTTAAIRKFAISTRTWTVGTNTVVTGAGATACYDGNGTIFVVRGGNTANVYNYNIGTDAVTAVNLTTGNAGAGADVACTGANDTLYLLHGNGGVLFSRLVSSTWTAMQTFTGSSLPYLNVNYGAALGTDGTDVYALIGNGRGVFLKYTVGSNSWSEMANLPTVTSTSAQAYSSSMSYDGNGNFYAIPGDWERDMWRYNISGNAWTKAADTPVRKARSMALTRSTTGGTMYFARGENQVSVYKFTPSSNTYIPSATWISAPMDLNFVSDFTTFTANHPTPGTSSISFSIRSSTDKVAWSAWEDIVSGATGDTTNFDMASVTTPNRRYVQVKVTLTSDGTNAPTLSDLTVTYEKDSTAPANPSVQAWGEAEKTHTLTNDQSYYYTNPYFEFTPATQTESPIAGYYAAWTTDPNFNPSDTGSYGEDYFQTGATYLVRRSMTRSGSGTLWYLRVATKDLAGNVSSSQTLFQYTYTGINNASAQQWTSQAQFTATGTTLSGVEATSSPGDVKLSSISNGAWTNEAPLPATVNNGASITYVSATSAYYILRGTNTTTFWRYNADKTYTTLAVYPGGNVYYGSSAIFVAPNGTTCKDSVGCLFVTRGGAQVTTNFYRYNIGGGSGYGASTCSGGGSFSADTWTACTNSTVATSYGGSLAFNGNDTIYALMGNSQNFYKYTLSTNTWSQLPNTDNNVTQGGTLVYTPNGTGCTDASGCLYATRGANTTHFWRFKIQANQWEYVQNTPIWFGDGASSRRINGTIYYTRGGNGTPSNDFYSYDLATSTWTRLANTPTNIYQGSEQGLAYNTDTNHLLTLRGYTETSIFSYDIANNSWNRTPSLPNFNTNNGFSAGVVAYDSADGMYYVGRGNGYADWWQYNPNTDAWKQLSDIPHTMSTGADAAFVDHANNTYDGIYILAGAEGLNDNIGYFYRYDPKTDTWTRLTNMNNAGAAVEPGAGADLVWDGSDALYTPQGGASTNYYKYVISTGTWSLLSGANKTVPAGPTTGSCSVRMNVGGTDYIYTTRGGNNANVYRFNIGTETWDAAATVENAPGGINSAATCVTDGQGNILFPRGVNYDMYALDPDGDANGVWTTRTVLQTYTGGMLKRDGGNIIFGFRGGSTSAADRYVVATGSTGFQPSGTWTSEILDFNAGNTIGLYGYAGLQVTMTDANDAYEAVETRTCSDAGCTSDANDAHWGAWTEVTNQRTVNGVDFYTVGSTVARYGQVRIRLTSDQVLTPTIQDVQWNYYVDSTAPNNPTAPVGGYTDSGKGTSITNNTWVNDLTPYFEWTSSDDANGIGIDGYYVYFGTDITKDPVTDASDPTNLAYKNGTNYYAATGLTSVGSWNALTQSATALTDGTYYLRIKTKDRNSNTAASAADAFTYKVDGSQPNSITDLSVATYMSSSDDFSFSWTEPADIGPSGIAQYCYHTGNSSDTCVAKGTICTSGTCTVSPVAHYQTRVNTFFVRARDAALNDAVSYASTGYFFTGGPPTAPQSVTVGPPDTQVDTNSFPISWTLPATCLGQTPCSASDILQYCYTINVPPSAGTCGTNTGGNPTPSIDGGWTTSSQTAARALPAFSAASLQGTNTVYVVAKDAVGNIDYANVTSQTYTFTSNAPGPPEGLTPTDASDRAANRYTITLTWDVPTDVGSGVESYKVYRCVVNGTDCDNPDAVDDPPANYTSIATVNTLGYLDTSLDTTKTYSYFVRSTGTGGTISGNSAVVSMKPEGKFKAAPLMSGNPTTKIRIRSAEISWLTQDDVDKNGNPVPHPATSYVQYGQTSSYGEGEPGTSDLVNEHTVTLTNLSPNTTYHYRLKWQDVDGNTGFSGDYTFITLGAPSAPTAVTATPSSGTTNSFAFGWTAPTDEGVTVASYRYSVNSTPTADNTTTTTATSVPAYTAATRQGLNTFYVVAVDDGGNVNYANYGSVDFTAYTTPPSPPQGLTLVDSSNRDAKRYSLTLTWDPSTVSAAGNVHVQTVDESPIYYTIYRSTDNSVTFTEIATITSTGYLDTGLDSTQKYTYKVTAKDKAGAKSDETVKLAAIPQGRYTSPPPITDGPTVTPDSFAAVVDWKTERGASSFVEFGLEQDKLSKEQGTADQITDHSVRVAGLSAKTVYYYRVKSIDIDQNVAYSDVATFTTLEAPRVENVNISDVRLTEATISWTTTKESTAVIEYGPTTDYGFTYSAAGGYSTTHTVKLESLKDGTTYHLRMEGADRSENPIASDDYNFTTLTFPKVLTVTSANKAEGQTEVKWTTNVPTTSEVEYYNDKTPNKTQGNSSLVTEHSILVFGLEDATEYKFKVRGRDQFGYEAVSGENKFRTLEDTTPPVISEVKSESNTVGSGDAAKIQIIVSWKTNEPTTSQVQYGEGLSGNSYSGESDENAERVQDHLMVVGGLTPAKTYHFRVVSKDKAGNESKSQGYSILTSRARQSFLQIVIGNLEDTFSWLGGISKLFGG